MKSRSKYIIDNSKVNEIFSKFGCKSIDKIELISGGEYNCLYDVFADGKDYILKVSPRDNFDCLTYEKGMMRAELFWYEQMRDKAGIAVPEIYFTDFSKSIIPANYFIMEKINGVQKDKVKYSKVEKSLADAEIARQVAQLHKVHNDKFGYVQGEKFDNWYDAYCSIITNLVADFSRKGKRTKKGNLLLKYAEKYKSVLNSAECCMVNTDCWDSNIMACKKGENYSYIWIDPERSMWGDKILDFACLDPLTPLEKKLSTLKEYNAVSETKIKPEENEIIRYAFAKGMMALILQVEKYYRYTPLHFGWWRNVIASRLCYMQAFGRLNKQ